MPRNASGTYTLPTGNPVVSGDIISSTWANDTMGDIASALTASLARDGSGGMTAALRLVDGTVSVPGLAFGNETGTGLYRTAAGDVSFAILGSQILRMRSTGLNLTGTLDVSSNAAVGGTLGVTGNLSVNTDKFTVAADTGNTAVAGTLNVAGNATVASLNGGALSGFRNAIINGNFGINQRGVSGTVSLSAGVYGHDRWKAGASGCTYTFATSENVTTLTISDGSLIQVVEGLNLQTGDYTLSWQGTAQGKIGAGSYGNSGITGSVTGGTNLNIEFGTGTLSLVQLEKGSVATPFEFRSIGQELALCLRYFEILRAGYVGPSVNGANNGFAARCKVEKRAIPTITWLSNVSSLGFGTGAPLGPYISNTTMDFYYYRAGTATQQDARYEDRYSANAEL